MRRPLVWCMLFFITGVVLGRLWLPEPRDLVVAFCLAAGIVVAIRQTGGRRVMSVATAAIAVLMGWLAVALHADRGVTWEGVPSGMSTDLMVRAQIVSEPEVRISKNQKRYYVFDASVESYGQREVDAYKGVGIARVSAFGLRGTKEPDYGDVWDFSGSLTRFEPEHAFEEGRLLLFVRGWKSRRVDDEQGARFKAYCIRARQAAGQVLSAERHDRSESVMRALVLGYSGELDKKTRTLFSDSGTLHIFAISGLHVGIAAVVLIFLFKLFGVPRPYWGLVLAPFLVGYIVMTGAKVSAIRACLMAILVWVGPGFGRKPDALSSLALAAFILLGFDPDQVVAPGFVLSFVIVTGLVLYCPPLYEWGMVWCRPDPFLVPKPPAPHSYSGGQ